MFLPRSALAFRNPLSFPTGRSARFDRSSPIMGRGLAPKIVAVAQKNSSALAMYDLLMNKVGGQSTYPYGPQIDGALGFCISDAYPFPNNPFSFTGYDATVYASATMAALYRPTSSASIALLFETGSGIQGAMLIVDSLVVKVQCGTNISSGITLTNGVPYFIAVSYNSSATLFVIKNLNTGAVVTASKSGFTASRSPNGNYTFGDCAGASYGIRGNLATLAYFSGAADLPSMVQLSDDPFSLWYDVTPLPGRFALVKSAPFASGAGEADGSATVSGAGAETAAGAGAAAGSATVSGAGAAPALVAGAGEADGSATVSGGGGTVEFAPAAGEADGHATVSGAGANPILAVGAGEADGSASAAGAGKLAVVGAGEADGSATVAGASAYVFTPDIFPTLPGQGWPVHRRPTYRTIVVKHPSGGDVRTPLWTYPLWEFEVVFEVLSADGTTQFPGLRARSLQILMGFYLYKGGAQGTFLFIDPDFNADTAVPLGTGDGTTRQFLFLRRMGSSIEPVSWVLGVPTVYLNGVAQSGALWSLNLPNGLTFNTPPGAGVAITADVSYGFVCRFLDDTADFEQMMWNLWEVKSIKFRQVRVPVQ